VTQPYEIDSYNMATKISTQLHERGSVELEYGEDSELPADKERPNYLFKKRKKSLCRKLKYHDDNCYPPGPDSPADVKFLFRTASGLLGGVDMDAADLP